MLQLTIEHLNTPLLCDMIVKVQNFYRKEADMSTFNNSVRRAALALLTAVASLLIVTPTASALPFSDHVRVRGRSCLSSQVDWVAYSGANSSGVIDAQYENEFWFSIHGVPAWPGNTYVFMTIKCMDGSWHDASAYISRPWGNNNIYDIGSV